MSRLQLLVAAIIALGGIAAFASARGKKPPEATRNLYPVIIAAGDLPPDVAATALRAPLVDGLEVVLVRDVDGALARGGTALLRYVQTSELSGLGLTAADAYRAAIANLDSAIEDKRLSLSVARGSDDKNKFVVGGGPFAASCLLIPKVRKVATEALHSEKLLALVSHRNSIVVFADDGSAANERLGVFFNDKEKPETAADRPISSRLLELLPPDTKGAATFPALRPVSWATTK